MKTSLFVRTIVTSATLAIAAISAVADDIVAISYRPNDPSIAHFVVPDTSGVQFAPGMKTYKGIQFVAVGNAAYTTKNSVAVSVKDGGLYLEKDGHSVLVSEKQGIEGVENYWPIRQGISIHRTAIKVGRCSSSGALGYMVNGFVNYSQYVLDTYEVRAQNGSVLLGFQGIHWGGNLDRAACRNKPSAYSGSVHVRLQP